MIMMKKFNKGVAALVMAMACAGMLTMTKVTSAAPVNNTTITNSNVNQKAVINWDKGSKADVQATGIGLAPEGMPGNRGMVLARRAAIVDAQRYLVETVKGMQIDSDTTMENMIVTSDVIQTHVSAVVKGAKIIEEHAGGDGSYTVVMSIPMYGVQDSLASATLPYMNVPSGTVPNVNSANTILSAPQMAQIQQLRYTGVIIDATGLDLVPTFAPVIYDENGRAVYGMHNVDRKFAISQGMVEYSRSLDQAMTSSRAGNNPLVIKAVGVRGGRIATNNVNVVVSAQDGDKILLANNNSNMLNQCAVVFVR